MSQADNLLDYLTVVAHEHNVIDDDQVFTIDPVTRQISCVAPERNVLVQEDHKSEVFRFRMPRIVEGHDMALCDVVRIAYINIQAESNDRVFSDGTYDVTDLHIDSTGNNIEFSWEVTAGSTQFEGTLNFGVIFKCMEGKRVTYRWGTFYYESVYVLKRLGSEVNFPIKYLDIIEQWKDEVRLEFSAYINKTVAADVAVAKAELDEQLHKDMDARYEEITTAVQEKHDKIDEQIDGFDEILKTEITNMDSEIDVLKARMNTFTSLPEGSTAGDAELADIHIGYDGTEYDNAGEAVRTQFADTNTYISGTENNLLEVLSNGTMQIIPIWELGGIDGATGKETTLDNRYRSKHFVQIPAEVITISAPENIQVMLFGYSVTDGTYTIAGQQSAEGVKAVEVKYDYYRFVLKNTATDVIDATIPAQITITYTPEIRFAETTYVNRQAEMFNDMILKERYVLLGDWEIGGINGSNGQETPVTDRIRTKGYFQPKNTTMYYEVADGYRLLVYIYEESKALQGMKGYVTGSGEIEVNTTYFYRFMLRGVEDFEFTGEEYVNLLVYTDLPPTKAELAEMVPDYWTDILEEKEQEIKNIVTVAAKNDQDIAMFFTTADSHYPSNSNISTVLRKYLCERCGVTLHVNLGDIIEDSTVSHEDGLQRVQYAMQKLMNGTDRTLVTPGNHDNNAGILDANQQILAERIIYDNEWIHHVSSKMLGLNNLVFDEKRRAFYYDDILQGIRFICIDSFENKTYDISDGIVNSYNLGRPSDRQMAWIRDVALTTVPDGYSVVSFSHLSLFPPYVNNGTEYVTVPHGGIGNGTTLTDIFGAFKVAGGKYIGHFAGHLHHDFLSTKNGLTCVVNLNDGEHWREASYFGEGFEFVGDAPKKTEGTVTECAFDVVIVNKTTQHVDLIRIGAGEDRQFDY